jgi:hypothetical protein
MEKKFAIGITIGAALTSSFNGVIKGTRREMDALGSTITELDKKKKLLQKFEMDIAQVDRAKQKVKELGAELLKSRNQMRSRDSNMAGIQAAIVNTTAAMKTASKEQKKGYQQSLQLLQKQLQVQAALPEKINQQRAALQSAAAVQNRMATQAEATKKAVTASGLAVTNLKSQYDRLNSSIAKVEQSEARRAKMGRLAQGIATGAAGVAAGAAVLAQPTKAALGYEYRLAGLANTAYAGESLDARKSGMAELKEGIHKAIREGGGTRDAAADTLDTLVASGAFGDGREGINKSLKMLPTLQKFGTASGADPKELAQIAIAASRFNIAEKDLPQALDMAMRAGQLGGFELKDMAKWLPQQMAAGRQSGISGLDGFGRILAVNQASRTTAGTTDEAGNNVVNWLAKINSNDTQKDVKKALGIDLPKYLATERGNGVDSMAAFVKLIDKVASGDKEYVKLRERASTEKDGEKRNTTEQMANILQGSAVGQLIQDRQALMGLLGYINNRQYMADIQTKTDPRTGAAIGTGQASFDLFKSTGQYNTDQLANEKAIAQDAAFSKLTPAINGIATTMVDLARQYPLMTTAVVAATTGLTALAAAAGGSALMQLLLTRGGGKGASGLVAAVAGKAGVSGAAGGVFSKIPGAAAAAQLVGRIGGVMPAGAASAVGKAATRVPWLGLGIGAMQVASVARNDAISGDKKKVAISGITGGAVGGIAGGAVAGAALGSIVPGIGTLLGGIVGGILGSFAGDKVGRSIAERIIDQSAKVKAPAALPAGIGGQPGATTPTSIEKKTSLDAKYTLNVNGVGMAEVNEMISRQIAMLQQQQETRMRAAMHDGGD